MGFGCVGDHCLGEVSCRGRHVIWETDRARKRLDLKLMQRKLCLLEKLLIWSFDTRLLRWGLPGHYTCLQYPIVDLSFDQVMAIYPYCQMSECFQSVLLFTKFPDTCLKEDWFQKYIIWYRLVNIIGLEPQKIELLSYISRTKYLLSTVALWISPQGLSTLIVLFASCTACFSQV